MTKSIFDRYLTEASTVESESPSPTLPKGEYPGKVIGAKLRHFPAGQGKNGPYPAFGSPSMMIQVTDGPMKGQSTWVEPPLAPPDHGVLEENLEKRLVHFSQKFYDATGFGLKVDPNWTKTTEADPNRPGREITKYRGRMLSKSHLAEIADNETDNAALCTALKGLTGIFRFGEKSRTSNDGRTFVEQTLTDVKPLNDANLEAWRSKQSTSSNMYS